MIRFRARDRYSQNSSGFLSFPDSTGMVRNDGIHTSRHSRGRKNLFKSFFIKPRLKILYDTQDRTVEYVSKIEDQRWGKVVERNYERTSPGGVPYCVFPFLSQEKFHQYSG